MDTFLLKQCTACGGDLVRDELDWRCLQCSRYYYGSLPGHSFAGVGSRNNVKRVPFPRLASKRAAVGSG